MCINYFLSIADRQEIYAKTLFSLERIPVVGVIASVPGMLIALALSVAKTIQVVFNLIKAHWCDGSQENRQTQQTQLLRDASDWGLILLNQIINFSTAGILNAIGIYLILGGQNRSPPRTQPLATVIGPPISRFLIKDVNLLIVDYSGQAPKKFTGKEIRSCARDFVTLSLVSKEFRLICNTKLAALKKVHDLVHKYCAYNREYEEALSGWEARGKKGLHPKGNPQLLDALFTGCNLPYSRSTFNTYNDEIENDIREIVSLMPQSLHCILGALRCRDDVPPLLAAVANKNIPLHIIEFLLQQGANPNATVKINGIPVKIFKDLETIIEDKDRLAALQNLFIKSGYTESTPKIGNLARNRLG